MTNCSPHRPEHDTVGRHSADVASAGEDGGSKSNRPTARAEAEAAEAKTTSDLHLVAFMAN